MLIFLSTGGGKVHIAEILGLSDLDRTEAKVEWWRALVKIMTEAPIGEPWTEGDASYKLAIEKLVEAQKEADAAFIPDTIEKYRRKVEELGLSQEDLARKTLIAKGATEKELEDFDKYVKQLKAPPDNSGDFQAMFTGWVQEGLDKLGLFDEKVNEVFANMAYQLTNVSFDAMLTGFNEIGKAIAQNADAETAFQNAIAAMGQQLLDAMPSLLLQAGLQMLATPGMWPIGLGLIAAAGAASLINGYVQEKTQGDRDVEANAQGNVFTKTAIVPYAAGGTFTNQNVRSPTFFRYGGGLGLMGEAGPEAIIPLKRMANGNLGVEAGTGGGTPVVVNIINNSGQEIEKRESEDENGNKQIDVIIGRMINQHLSSGKADRAMAGRYDVRVRGV
jgi:phage-related minor tail protein